MTTTTHLPHSYLLLFTLIDIILPTLGVLSSLFAPSLAAESNSFIPPGFHLPLTFWAACLAVLQITNIYIRRDYSRQTLIQSAAAAMDVFLLGLYVKTIVGEGRTGVRDWNGGDWFRIDVYLALALGRLSYVVSGAESDDGGKDGVVQAAEGKKSL